MSRNVQQYRVQSVKKDTLATQMHTAHVNQRPLLLQYRYASLNDGDKFWEMRR